MDNNETAQNIINAALLPNFLFLLGLFLMLGFLWYHFDYKLGEEESNPEQKDRD
ncbi:MAG: hypothetical protein U9N52_00430 [Campylobacterota bacterium]|nr:hypothetical protein [Campylobacterota bacterium]